VTAVIFPSVQNMTDETRWEETDATWAMRRQKTDRWDWMAILHKWRRDTSRWYALRKWEYGRHHAARSSLRDVESVLSWRNSQPCLNPSLHYSINYRPIAPNPKPAESSYPLLIFSLNGTSTSCLHSGRNLKWLKFECLIISYKIVFWPYHYLPKFCSMYFSTRCIEFPRYQYQMILQNSVLKIIHLYFCFAIRS
jgi:hypothetical protein